MDGPGSESGQAQVTFLLSEWYGKLWDPIGLPSNRYRGSFPREKCRGVKLTIHLHIVKRLRMNGTLPPYLLCFGDRASLYNLVNKANLVHNLFLVYLSISTCFGRLCAHHQEKQLCLCDTWYLLFCVDNCLVCRSICSYIPDNYPHRITSTKCRINIVVSPDDGHIVARNM